MESLRRKLPESVLAENTLTNDEISEMAEGVKSKVTRKSCLYMKYKDILEPSGKQESKLPRWHNKVHMRVIKVAQTRNTQNKANSSYEEKDLITKGVLTSTLQNNQPEELFNLRNKMTNFKDILYDEQKQPWGKRSKGKRAHNDGYSSLRERIQQTSNLVRSVRNGKKLFQDNLPALSDFQVPYFSDSSHLEDLSTFLQTKEKEERIEADKKVFQASHKKRFPQSSPGSPNLVNSTNPYENTRMLESAQKSFGLKRSFERECTPTVTNFLMESIEKGKYRDKSRKRGGRANHTSLPSSGMMSSVERKKKKVLPSLKEVCEKKEIAFNDNQKRDMVLKKSTKLTTLLKTILNSIDISDLVKPQECQSPPKARITKKGRLWYKQGSSGLPSLPEYKISTDSPPARGTMHITKFKTQSPTKHPRHLTRLPTEVYPPSFQNQSTNGPKKWFTPSKSLTTTNTLQFLQSQKNQNQLPHEQAQQQQPSLIQKIMGAFANKKNLTEEEVERKLKSNPEEKRLIKRIHDMLLRINPLHGVVNTFHSMDRKKASINHKLTLMLNKMDLDRSIILKEKMNILFDPVKDTESLLKSGYFKNQIRIKAMKRQKLNSKLAGIYQALIMFVIKRHNVEPLPIEKKFLTLLKLVVEGSWVMTQYDFYEILEFLMLQNNYNHQIQAFFLYFIRLIDFPLANFKLWLQQHQLDFLNNQGYLTKERDS